MARCCTTHCQLDNSTHHNINTQQTTYELHKSNDIKKRKFKDSFEHEFLEDLFDSDYSKKIHLNDENQTNDKEVTLKSITDTAITTTTTAAAAATTMTALTRSVPASSAQTTIAAAANTTSERGSLLISCIQDSERGNPNLVCYQDILFERLETGRWKSVDLGNVPFNEYLKYHEELVNYKRKMYNGTSTIAKFGLEFTDEAGSDSDENDDLPEEVIIEHVPLCKQHRGRSHCYKPKIWSKLGQVLIVLKDNT